MADKKFQKIIALEYAILKLIDWSLTEKDFLDLKDFEARNDYSINKVLLLNFFVATANGTEHREEMFHFYDSFYALPMGYVEKDVEENIQQFKYITFNEVGTKIRFKSDFESILKNNQIDFDKYKESHKIDHALKGNTFSNVFDLINHSLKVFKDNNWKIMEYDEETLGRLSRKHSTWSIYRIIPRLNNAKIDSEFLIKEKSMFAANAEDRILI